MPPGAQPSWLHCKPDQGMHSGLSEWSQKGGGGPCPLPHLQTSAMGQLLTKLHGVEGTQGAPWDTCPSPYHLCSHGGGSGQRW